MSSGHNKRFLANPVDYLKEVLVVPNDGRFDGRTATEGMTHFRGGTNPVLQSHDQHVQFLSSNCSARRSSK